MTITMRRLALGAAAGLFAIGIGAGAFVHAQDQTANPPSRPFRGGPGAPGGRGGFEGPGGLMGMLPMMARELNLTDAQRAQIKAIADAHRDEWKALFDRERAARMALNEAVTADAVDEGLVRQRSGELAMIDADVAVARAHAYAQFVQILTPQQRATLKDARARRQGHRG